ncbi:MAG: YraN family protein [Microthrixaceae bacterium]
MNSKQFDPKQLGQSGENRAAAWYQSQGCRIVARNWRCRDGELDLIIEDGNCVVFAEVKTRSSDRYGTPFEAVGWRKQQKLRLLARHWLADNPTVRSRELRFDLVGIIGTRVEVRKSVF